MTGTAFTNPHTVEVAHDTELLRLLGERNIAAHRLTTARSRLMGAASLGHRVGNRVGNYGVYDGLPVGALYTVSVRNGRLSDTVTRVKAEAGESDHADRLATVNDALTVDPLLGVDAAGLWTHDPYLADEKRAERVEWLAATRAAYLAAVDSRDVAVAAVADHEANYTGWDRYFLVVSSDGHVHRSMDCSTCRETTVFAPMPSLSAASLDEAVALVGPALCSVCYPLAPTDMVDGVKVTGKLAEVLLTDGEEVFRAKLAALAAKRAERCPGSGTTNHDRAGAHLYRAWGRCDVCGDGVSITSTGKLRAHKPKARPA